MAVSAGYLLKVAAGRRQELKDAIGLDAVVAEAVPEFQHSRNVPLIGFISFASRKITHIARASRGVRAATGLRRISLREIIELSSPITFQSIERTVTTRAKSRVKTKLAVGGLLPPATFTEIVEALMLLSPETRPLLNRFSRQRQERLASLSTTVRQNLALQKDAVGVALVISGIGTEDLQEWEPPVVGLPTSFLDGLESVRVREDPMVINDLQNMPGFELVRSTQFGASMFVGDGTKLTIILANRLPLEEQFGVDLIYCNETYKAFVMVQYKAMEPSDNGPVFRLPNQQLTTEIGRMREVYSELANFRPSAELNCYRLMANPFFLKLCSRVTFNPDDMSLFPGMYLPLDYWQLLEQEPSLTGPRGGRVITFQNVKRYLGNRDFAALVGNAWVGTTITQSQVLETVIREVIESGRTLVWAVTQECDEVAQEEASEYNIMPED